MFCTGLLDHLDDWAMPDISPYYKIRWAPDETFAMFESVPVTETGVRFRDDASAAEYYLARMDKRPMGDCVAILAGYFIVSDRFREIMCKLQVSQCVKWVRVKAAPEGFSFDCDYWLVVPLEEFSTLDLARSKYSFFPGTRVVGQVEKWVFEAHRIPSCDLFRANRDWFISRRAKELLEEEGMSGMALEPVSVSP